MGLNQFLRTLEVGRISIAALSLSLTQAVLDLATDHAKQRVQFGQPISSFSGDPVQARRHRHRARGGPLAHLCAPPTCATPASRSGRRPRWHAQGQPHRSLGGIEAVQVHGGLGYMLESPVARFCDSKVLEIGEGTNEISTS